MLDGIVEHGLDPSLVGKSRRKSRPPDPGSRSGTADPIAPVGSPATARRTAAACSAAPHGRSPPRRSPDAFDLLVVDEAGQFSLANTVAVSTAARNLLLLGDPQQLPQVSQGTAPGAGQRVGARLAHGRAPDPARDLGYFLATSYRMCEQVCAPVSNLSYEGRLASSAPARGARRRSSRASSWIEVAHGGNRTESRRGGRRGGRPGRLAPRHPVDRGRRRPGPLGERDILVVAPYNAQVALIRQTLAARGRTEVRVGTVDKFQGQQAPVTIVSLTASSPKEAARGMGFLLNRNRLNVAVSRAKWLSVIVHSPEITHYLPHTVPGLLELGGFLALLDSRGGATPAV